MDGPDSTASDLAGALLPPFLAVVAVAAILTGLFAWLGPGDPARDTAVAGPRASASPSAASPTPTVPASSPVTSSPAPATSTPEPSEPSEPAGRERPEVVVLNQSGGARLAEQVAERLRKVGWVVERTDSFRGTVRTTTVYHPAGLKAAARALAKDLPGDPRVMERFGNLSGTRLTVVLTDDYGS